MSSNSTTSRRTRLYRGIVAFAATALAAVGIGFALNAGATQANFTDDAPVTVHADAGYLDLTATGTVSFSKLVPGHAQSSTVTFNNSGNVGGALTMGLPVSVTNWTLPSGQNPNLAQVMVRVTGSANLNTAVRPVRGAADRVPR